MEYIEKDTLINRLKASPIFMNFGEDGMFILNAVLDIINKQYVVSVSGTKYPTPCSFCVFNPPSSTDCKPCYM